MTWYTIYRILLAVGATMIGLVVAIGYTLAVIRWWVGMTGRRKTEE